ncbi:hypothetical protein N7532_008378 [Penicillium argentinense]|uniref:Uncharacterized protein n=1 Tax=Penicillium argentinense TaxID=1131581 RepID=A0A9W9EXG6_9EURO|nr:uncharacterized protein N7532_008378 [Penicillium argentinense]KAJ5089694.1 hypothetical protein N7532_008378 [Penicillium argentinense]
MLLTPTAASLHSLILPSAFDSVQIWTANLLVLLWPPGVGHYRPPRLTMNDIYNVPSSRGVPHAEASAETATPLAGDSNHTAEIQVPRSPQPLSLQVNCLEAGVYSRGNSNVSYVESSEHGSDTSDGHRPELQSASTFTDSLPSIPSSSLNDSNRSMDLDTSYGVIGSVGMPRTEQKASDLLETLHTSRANGNVTATGTNSAVKSERHSDDFISPLRSPKNSSARPQGAGTRFVPGHKRTATGDIKHISSTLASSRSSDTIGAARRRSKSMGSSAHGSRIAQLSVHIRTRLSYAAAKVEKSRQSPSSIQLALRGLENLPSPDTPSNGIASTQDSTHIPHAQNGQRPSSTDALPNHQHSHHRSYSAISSPGKLLQIPKLAPPADIVSSVGDTRRRRPNPNWASKPFDHSPYARHRRHHSHQEHSIIRPLNGSSPRVMGPGTPSILPTSRGPTSSQNIYYGSRTQSENTAMEQDAIETLLFMSSPENSGYRSSPRPLQQPPATRQSLNASLYSHNHSNGVGTPQNQNPQDGESLRSQDFKSRDHGRGLEAHAGDEIDRILDQMDSDSDDDARYASHRHIIKAPQSRWHRDQRR